MNIIDRHDIPAIHTHINNILNDMNSLPAIFTGYYNDDFDRVRLVDILEYLGDHISTPGQGLEVTPPKAEKSARLRGDDVHVPSNGRKLRMTDLLGDLQKLCVL